MKQHLGMMKSLEPFLTLPYSLLISIHSLLAKSVVKRSDAIIAVSNFVKRVLAVNGFDPRKIHVIYNPIDTVGRTCSSKRRLPPFILFVGSLSLEKGIQNVIKIMPQVRAKAKETCLTIVGDGPEREYLRSLISELNVENCVQLLGRITDDHLAGLYQSSSLVVVPSIWPEPFGRVVAEALSYNKPVVASSVGGISELVDRDDGILVPPNDENALMNALVLILTGGSSKSGPHRDSKFSPQAIAMQYNSVIASTIRSIRAEIHN
jgi:glycosyltransferase involved in cell wall biosynthesis